MRLLIEAGYPQRICAAGLFHSIYGTSIFKHTSIVPDARGRAVVREVVGEEAEHLVWLFHSIDRPGTLHAKILPCANGAFPAGEEVLLDKTDGTTIHVTRRQFEDLLAVEMANMIDQGPLNATKWPGFEGCEPYIRIQQRMKRLSDSNSVCTCLSRRRRSRLYRIL
ncbi:hypothetical protein GUITHDRAFT_135325 [Guillardia theta CCMP2712]|uniref:DUF6817 domain-containing protein n=1 Tax=Guillardia theta (strain CCMP2712) TaxID=905079 RepID=L1JPY5_GUITC|nr:hypothetical protein GUITHDRAFT_135325 [Guillardia theta CCMP2712]EKX50138.1 hypothetical protein GUITHDRAFT_135325 [Guillardia theta CCMP2712]|eukprot:XP_005837118.1 hypothetical protein GUITHDRAFT_135325 [Guillardia theta CCMP2712]